ncbi:MAG: hypothetical protein HY687_01860 [Chloroflexi bacterium]|nr:hypothetical protein [Chloroflexota bacterium]
MPHHQQKGISHLDEVYATLSVENKRLFRRIFQYSVGEGTLVPPLEMLPWIETQFGSVEAVTHQRITKVYNRITGEGALFNSLRAKRPISAKEHLGSLAHLIDESIRIKEPLDDPLTRTPEDTFGRIRGEYSISCANIAKYDIHHGMLILNEHNPLHFSWEQFHDILQVASQWLEAAHRTDPQAKYPFFMWNCLWRAGASMIHSHTQVLLGRDAHYAKVEALRRHAWTYRRLYRSDYFQDLYRVHEALGLGFEKQGVHIMVYLTPTKEREILLLGDRFDRSYWEMVHMMLLCFRDVIKSISFNLGIALPPLAPVREDWSRFPVVARLVDRGELTSRSSDIGTMELYATTVVAADPFDEAQLIMKYMLKR